jgi:hypothetical protein
MHCCSTQDKRPSHISRGSAEGHRVSVNAKEHGLDAVKWRKLCFLVSRGFAGGGVSQPHVFIGICTPGMNGIEQLGNPTPVEQTPKQMVLLRSQ